MVIARLIKCISYRLKEKYLLCRTFLELLLQFVGARCPQTQTILGRNNLCEKKMSTGHRTIDHTDSDSEYDHSGKDVLNEMPHRIRNPIQRTAAQGNLTESSSAEVLVGNAHVSTWICTSQNEDLYVTPRHFHHFHSPPPHFHSLSPHFHSLSLTSALSHRTLICMPGGVCHPNGAPHEDTCICSACRLFKITNDLDCRLRELAVKVCSHRTYQNLHRTYQVEKRK